MDLRISSPCPMAWADLVGNDRVRYCGQCKLNVYNLADMSPQEVEALVRRTDGRLCGRLYLRGDRTASLRNCPTAERKRVMRRIGAVLAVLLLTGFAWVFRGMEGPDRSRLPAWVRDVLQMVDPQEPSRGVGVVGRLCPTNVPPPPPPAPSSQSN